MARVSTWWYENIDYIAFQNFVISVPKINLGYIKRVKIFSDTKVHKFVWPERNWLPSLPNIPENWNRLEWVARKLLADFKGLEEVEIEDDQRWFRSYCFHCTWRNHCEASWFVRALIVTIRDYIMPLKKLKLIVVRDASLDRLEAIEEMLLAAEPKAKKVLGLILDPGSGRFAPVVKMPTG